MDRWSITNQQAVITPELRKALRRLQVATRIGGMRVTDAYGIPRIMLRSDVKAIKFYVMYREGRHSDKYHEKNEKRRSIQKRLRK